jgi:hypothetical protein
MANEKNLIPLNLRTKSERRKLAIKAGIASGESRRKTKELVKVSEYLHEFIDSQQEDIRTSLKEIVVRGGRPLVALIKEIREATEGSKVHNTGEMDSNITIKFE